LESEELERHNADV